MEGNRITATSFASIDDYIGACPPAVQQPLQELRALIHANAPEAVEAIRYQMPTFLLNGSLVHFAAFKKHIGIYAAGGIAELAQELRPYEGEKGTLRFPLSEPLPLALIARVIQYRVAENLKKPAPKRAKKSARAAESL